MYWKGILWYFIVMLWDVQGIRGYRYRISTGFDDVDLKGLKWELMDPYGGL